MRLRLAIVLGGCWAAAAAWAGTIDTGFIEQPWPKERLRQFEVGRYEVRWRERVSKHDGLWTGVRFGTKLPRQAVWELATDYTGVGRGVHGVKAVRILEESPTRRLIEVDIKVLWKELRLAFEVEQEPPSAIRFRLVNRALGEFRGVCLFADDAGGGTDMELSTRLQPARRVPMRLLLFAERLALLEGVKRFLETCDARLHN